MCYNDDYEPEDYNEYVKLEIPSSFLSDITFFRDGGDYIAVNFHNSTKTYFYSGESWIINSIVDCDHEFTPSDFWHDCKDRFKLEAVYDYSKDPEECNKAYKHYFYEHYDDPVHFSLVNVSIPRKV